MRDKADAIYVSRKEFEELKDRVIALESPDYWSHYWESYHKYFKTLSPLSWADTNPQNN